MFFSKKTDKSSMSELGEKNYNRRKFPRRELVKKVGVLFGGEYFICTSGTIGEGGMSIVSEYALNDGQELVVSFQVPEGSFVTLRGLIRSTNTDQGLVTHGISFNIVPHSFKRQIRAFVSARISSQKI
jgi:hypothetical protein